ncbi:hypothetical protein AMTR_s03421p00001220 [Amborella trichopoda]|uniref:F-box/LRR-repeat protein 15/At3g58940/PEG3-like LRR domain-containing protein n=1 Tax=Amborella trichopoda TaxID=13333 RepID=U5D046_AMBTC|nr:hypothetical protein AMTR_s03421p00001220 [Amborella trichopoda]
MEVWAFAPSLNITDDTGKIKNSKDLNWSFIGEQALSLHNGPILAGQCDLDQWIPLLTRKGLQKLKLNFLREGLPPLKNLTLASVRLNDSILESLVSGSGRLEKLQLLGCDGLSHLKIHASSLLVFHVECKFNAINLSKSSNLKEFIVFQCERDNAFASCLAKFWRVSFLD